MRFHQLIAVLGILSAASVSAQANLPACALTDFTSAVQGSGCAFTNITCICANPSVISSVSVAIKTNCNAADQAAASSAAGALCTNSVVTVASMTATGTVPMTTPTKPMSGLLLTDTVTLNGTMVTATQSASFSGTSAVGETSKSHAEAGPDFRRYRFLSAVAAIGAMALLFAKF